MSTPKWMLVITGHYREKGEVHSVDFFDQHDDGLGPSPYVLGDFPVDEARAIVDELNRCGVDPAALATIRRGGKAGPLPRTEPAEDMVHVSGEAESIQLLSPKPGDTIVLRYKQLVGPHLRERLERQLSGLFPFQQVIVVDGGLNLEVQKPQSEAAKDLARDVDKDHAPDKWALERLIAESPVKWANKGKPITGGHIDTDVPPGRPPRSVDPDE